MNNPLSAPMPPIVAALIVAGGSGARMGGDVPKQYRRLGADKVLTRAVRTFLEHPGIAHVQVVIDPAQRAFYDDAVGELALPSPVQGGSTRQHSVLNGLMALQTFDPDAVLIHDAARPMVSHELIDRVLAGLAVSAAVVPALPVNDTLKVREPGGYVRATVPREEFALAQTPQGFNYRLILAAHSALEGRQAPDDAALVEQMGGQVLLVDGDPRNLKLTTPLDWRIGEAMLSSEGAP